ncbi:MAG: methionyl-tRNA formyltransferase [Oscillospiraceae bacterium]|nr:methionyl-tRNA formyltransferase [Oscillospiraceae bacterium]
MKIVFMGTPDFAVPSLRALAEAGHEIRGVFTQPDRPKDRGMKLQPPPVKELALALGLEVYQPAKMRDGTALDILRALEPDLVAVAAYGKILPVDMLELPRLGCVNVHSSLLPKYRGAAPINWAILNGEDETGVTIMRMAEGMDTGDILAQARTPIGIDENAAQLFARLADLGAGLLADTVAALEAGTAEAVPQDEARATHAPMLSRELSPMDWTRTARRLHDQVRGLRPWPAATAALDGVRCKVLRTALTGERTEKAPGTVLQADKRGLRIACGDGGVLELAELQPDGKKAMTAPAFLLGHPIPPGTILTKQE